MNAHETRLFERAALGLDFEEFKATRVGRHLIERAEDYKRQALERLALADPEDPRQIRLWQNQIQVTHLFLDWLEATVTDGRNAHEQLRLDEVEVKING